MTASHVFLWSLFKSLFELWLWDILGGGPPLLLGAMFKDEIWKINSEWNKILFISSITSFDLCKITNLSLNIYECICYLRILWKWILNNKTKAASHHIEKNIIGIHISSRIPSRYHLFLISFHPIFFCSNLLPRALSIP